MTAICIERTVGEVVRAEATPDPCLQASNAQHPAARPDRPDRVLNHVVLVYLKHVYVAVATTASVLRIRRRHLDGAEERQLNVLSSFFIFGVLSLV
jgi:hypothetical protein